MVKSLGPKLSLVKNPLLRPHRGTSPYCPFSNSGPDFGRISACKNHFFYVFSKNFQNVVTFFLLELRRWPRYGKDSILHELSEKQHRVTQKSNKSNKNNMWRFGVRSTLKRGWGVRPKNMLLQAIKRAYKARNLQF